MKKRLRSGIEFSKLCESIPKISVPIYDPIEIDELAKMNKQFHIFKIDYRGPKNNKHAWVRLVIGVDENNGNETPELTFKNNDVKNIHLYTIEGYHAKICEFIGNIVAEYSDLNSILPITNVGLMKAGGYWMFKDSADKVIYAEEDPIFSKYFE